MHYALCIMHSPGPFILPDICMFSELYTYVACLAYLAPLALLLTGFIDTALLAQLFPGSPGSHGKTPILLPAPAPIPTPTDVYLRGATRALTKATTKANTAATTDVDESDECRSDQVPNPNTVVIEHTPAATIVMKYRSADATFEYYSDKTNIAFNMLDAVCKQFCAKNGCTHLYTDMDVSETKIARKNYGRGRGNIPNFNNSSTGTVATVKKMNKFLRIGPIREFSFLRQTRVVKGCYGDVDGDGYGDGDGDGDGDLGAKSNVPIGTGTGSGTGTFGNPVNRSSRSTMSFADFKNKLNTGNL